MACNRTAGKSNTRISHDKTDSQRLMSAFPSYLTLPARYWSLLMGSKVRVAVLNCSVFLFTVRVSRETNYLHSLTCACLYVSFISVKQWLITWISSVLLKLQTHALFVMRGCALMNPLYASTLHKQRIQKWSNKEKISISACIGSFPVQCQLNVNKNKPQ